MLRPRSSCAASPPSRPRARSERPRLPRRIAPAAFPARDSIPAGLPRILARARPQPGGSRMLRLALLTLVLLAFAVLTVEATLAHGYLGVFEAMAANAATRLAFVDLTLSLGLVLLWMWGDARGRALPFW